jgi:hypothetical protein
MKWTRPALSTTGGFAYSLGNSLYIPLTSFSNSRTLPETRGPNFLLPPAAVAALCRVRDAEHGTDHFKDWCQWLDGHESPVKLPPAALDPFESQSSFLGETTASNKSNIIFSDRVGRRPTVAELLHDLEAIRDFDRFRSIVIAGEGEPTLRMASLEALVHGIGEMIRKNSIITTSIRVTTNGLAAVDCTTRLFACGVSSVSVALMTHDAAQYETLMMSGKKDEDQTVAHVQVQNFIRAAVRTGLQVEVTAVNRPDVDKEATSALALSLGVVPSAVRWRPFFP